MIHEIWLLFLDPNSYRTLNVWYLVWNRDFVFRKQSLFVPLFAFESSMKPRNRGQYKVGGRKFPEYVDDDDDEPGHILTMEHSLEDEE